MKSERLAIPAVCIGIALSLSGCGGGGGSSTTGGSAAQITAAENALNTYSADALAYTAPSGSATPGVLTVQGSTMNADSTALVTVLGNATSSSVGSSGNGLNEVLSIGHFLSSWTSGGGYDTADCQAPSGGAMLCYIPNTNQRESVTFLTNNNGATVTWALSDNPTKLSGTITTAGSNANATMTMDGFVDPMIPGSSKTKVGYGTNASANCGGTSVQNPLVMSMLSNGNGSQTVSLEGDLRDVIAVSSSLGACNNSEADLKLTFGTTDAAGTSNGAASGTVSSGNVLSQDSANLAATIVTPNHKFVGTFTASGLQQNTAGSAYGGTLVFSGSIWGAGLSYTTSGGAELPVNPSANDNFAFLKGDLSATVTLSSAAYVPSGAATASNYQNKNLTFSGSVFSSATDGGLAVALGVSQIMNTGTGVYDDSISLTYDDNVSDLTVTTTAQSTGENPTLSALTITASNGVVIDLTQGGNGTITDSGNQVGTVTSGVVHFNDGSTRTLF
jgi:hypothetical protein